MVNYNFKKDESGNYIFYPWGVLGNGRVLPDKEMENRVRDFVRGSLIISLISLPVILIICVTIGWVYDFVFLLGIIAWYHLKIRTLLAACLISHDKLTLKKSYTDFANLINKKILWLLLILSIISLPSGVLMFIQGTTSYDKLMGAIAFIFCIIWTFVVGYMIKTKRT